MFTQCSTIPDLLNHVVSKIHSPAHTFMLQKKADTYHAISYSEAFAQIESLATYFIDQGILKGDRLGLITENSPQYVYYDQALQQLGAINVSIYPTLSESDIQYILNDSGIKMLLVGSAFLLKKILKVANHCPALQTIIPNFKPYQQVSTSLTKKQQIIHWDEAIQIGRETYKTHQRQLDACKKAVKPEDIAALIYTSGTTGIPKGAMLSHANFIQNVQACLTHLTSNGVCAINHHDVFLSCLPLSHVFERTATYLVCCTVGCTMAFSESLALIGKNMLEIKPTVMMVVPRMLEKITEKATRSATQSGRIKAHLFNWAMQIGNRVRKEKENNQKQGILLSLQYWIASALVFSKVKQKTGGKLKFFISGGAALPQNVAEFFGNLGIKILEGYGLTETSPVVAITEVDRLVLGTVGRIIPGITVALAQTDTQQLITTQSHDNFDPTLETAEGEILIKGHCLMQGYYQQPEETAYAIDAGGWLHSGDIGKFYKGNLQITDRIKNILINSFGKNIYPTQIENTYLASDKIEQIFLIGDKREYLSAIIVPSAERLQETFGMSADYFEQADPWIYDSFVKDWLKTDVRRLSAKLSKFECIRNFCIKRKPFSIDSGELTPTLKAKRRIIEQKYQKTIQELYQQPTDH